MITIDLNTPIPLLQDYLEDKGLLFSKERILSLKKPGEGNMNVVIRLTTDRRSLILKQSRPYVQKYQQIPAPLDRIDVEYRFYDAIKNDVIAPHIPEILGYESQDYLLTMEDLGQVEDMTQLYSSRIMDGKILDKLIELAAAIHNSKPVIAYPPNSALRQLNHQHIFVLPFLQDNGFQLDDIQPGLQHLSQQYKTDESLKKVVETIGEKYLSAGDTLIHGDYYPGSWMTVNNSVFIIDPEFSFMGFAEFDLGVMIAHIVMATMDTGFLETIPNRYPLQVSPNLVKQIVGIEIMRRLIGLAQLPLNRSIDEKDYLLQEARKMILG